MANPPDGVSRQDFVRSVDWVIQQRRTRKVHDGAGLEPRGDASPSFETAVRQAIAVAGWAPFHYPRDARTPEPWRFYVLDRAALDALHGQIDDLMIGKLPKIFAHTGALIHVTWIPETDPSKQHLDWEHAAAAAAAVQNLLLAAEARGMATYWSSAKPLGSERMFQVCGIPASERYGGSVFLGRPLPDDREATEGFDGKMRRLRTPPDAGWCTWVRIAPPPSGG